MTNSDRFQNEMNNISFVGGSTDEQDNNGGEYKYRFTAKLRKRPGTPAEKERVHKESEAGGSAYIAYVASPAFRTASAGIIAIFKNLNIGRSRKPM